MYEGNKTQWARIVMPTDTSNKLMGVYCVAVIVFTMIVFTVTVFTV